MERRWDGGSQAIPLAVSALAPACLAATHIGNVAGAAHDAGVVRVVGWDAQPWRALDVAIGSVFALLPLGTATARAAMGGAFALGMLGAVLFVVARQLLGLATVATSPRLGLFVSAVAALAATAAAPLQLEAAQPGGSTNGALILLAPLALLSTARGEHIPWRAIAVGLGLATGQEPLTGICALGATAAFLLASAPARLSLASAWRSEKVALGACALGGLAPFLLALERAREAGLPPWLGLTEGWAGEGGASLVRSPVHYVGAELGTLFALLAAGGAVLAFLAVPARPLTSALLALVVLGFACAWAGAPTGPSRFGAPVLAATGAACALAGVAMQALVRWVAGARLPFARASAAMVLLLELVIPVDEADQSLFRGMPLAREEVAARWDDVAWGTLPPKSVLLITDRRLYARAAAAVEEQTLRGDVALVPTFARGASGRHALASDPALVPLWRDLELLGAPTEASLSSLASARPVAMAYEPRWGRAIGRHLVPVALLDCFEAEPRGPSDRRRALEAFAPQRDRLLRVIGPVTQGAERVARDPELTEVVAYLLRARVQEVAASGDRDLVGRAWQDLHAFAQDPLLLPNAAPSMQEKASRRFDESRP